MRHGKRSTLTTEDINSALRLRNVEVRPPRVAAAAAAEGAEPGIVS